MADEGFWENLKQADLAGLKQNLWEGARDEWLGIDDFTRVPKKFMEGDYLGMLKALGAGTMELGGTALMLLPGGQPAALAAKGGMVGKLGKGLKFLQPLTLEEQAAARLARQGGAKARLFKGPLMSTVDDIIGKEIVLDALKPTKDVGKFREMLSGLKPQVMGMGPGGYAGSLIRGGIGQWGGLLPAEQGKLAKKAFAIRNATPIDEVAQIPLTALLGEKLSGKLGAIGSRTGIDTVITGPAFAAIGAGAAPRAVQPSLVDLYLMDMATGSQNVPQIQSLSDAIWAQIYGGISPQAAM